MFRLKWIRLFKDVQVTCHNCSSQGIGRILKFSKIKCPNCGRELENEL